MQKLVLSDNLLIAHPRQPSGHTWTYASILGDALYMAQEMFGERDCTYTVLGVEFTTRDRPQIWFPSPRSRKDIIVQITQNCLDEPFRACFQLSHEVVHLLSPTGESYTNVLEEGLAVYFSYHYMTERIGKPTWRYNIPSYEAAFALVKPLLDMDANAIKTLRQHQPTIGKISTPLLRELYPQLRGEVAAMLGRQFVR